MAEKTVFEFEIRRITSDVSRIRRDVDSLENAIRDLADETSRSGSSAESAESKYDRLADKFQQLGDRVQTVAAGFSTLAQPAVDFFENSIDQALSFETAMANAGAVIGKNADEMQGLSAEVLALGSTALAGPQATAEAFYDIVSGVQDADSWMAILNASIATSEAGASDLGATTNALVGIMNAYGLSAEDAARVSDILTRTVGMGVLTMDELAAAMPQVTGIASSMGVELEEVAGMMARITQNGTPAAEASTQLKAAMTALLNPNEQLSKAFDELGVSSGQELVEQFGSLQEAFTAIADTSVATDEGLAAVLGSSEALQGILPLLGDDATEFLTAFEDGIDGATDAAREIQREAPENQFKLIKAEIQGIAIEIGRELLPELLKGVKAMKPFLGQFKDFVRNNKSVIVAIAAIVAVIAGLGMVLAPIGAAITALTTIFGFLGAIVGAVSLPILLIVAALVALGVAYKENFLGFGDAVDDVASKVGDGLKAIVGFVGDLINAFDQGGFAGAATFIYDQLIKPIIDGVQNLDTGQLLADLQAIGTNALGAIKTGITVGATWFYDNVIVPLSGQIATYIESGQIVDDLKAAGTAWLEALKLQLDIATQAATFIYDKIISPLVSQLWTYISSGLMIDNLKAAGTAWLAALSGAIDILFNAGTMIFDKIISPLITQLAVYIASGQLFDDLTAMGNNLLETLKTAIAIGESWFLNNLVNPLVADFAATDWSGLIANLTSKAGDLATAFADELKAQAAGIWTTFKTALNDAMPDSVSFAGSVKTDFGTFGFDFGTLNLPDNPFYAGTSWTGSGGVREVAGIVHNREAVVPHDGMRVVPSPAGLMLEGATGGTPRELVVPVTLQLDGQTLYYTLERIKLGVS